MTNIIQGNFEDDYNRKDAHHGELYNNSASLWGSFCLSIGFAFGWTGAAIGGAVGLSIFLGLTYNAKRLQRLMWILRNVVPQELTVKLMTGPLFGRVIGNNFLFDHIYLDGLAQWNRDLFRSTSDCEVKAYTDPDSGRVIAVQLPGLLIWQ